MPVDPPSPSGRPDHNRPSPPEASGEPIEGDLWNLDDDIPEKQPLQPTPAAAARKTNPDESSRESAAAVQRGKMPARAPERSREAAPPKQEATPAKPHDEIGDLDMDLEDGDLENLKGSMPVGPYAGEEEQLSPSVPTSVATSTKTGTNEPRKNRPKPPAPAEPGSGISWPKPSRREVMGLGAFAFVLLVIAIWAVSRFFTQLHFESEFVKLPDYPIKGEHSELASGETFWREPVREGANRDVAKREVAMIPVLNLTLDPGKSPNGALRVIFRNEKGEAVGDSITRSFTGGRFDATGEDKISFPATDGFLDEATFNSYRTRAGNPWMADVMEGPSVDAQAGSFKKLVQIPVLPQRR